MVERARRGMDLNGLTSRAEIIHGDVREVKRLFTAGIFDSAVCNPPYRLQASGRMNPDPEKRLARHEVGATLRDFLHAGAYLLRHQGKLAVVYPVWRGVELLETMRHEKMEPKRLRMVHSRSGVEATLLLVEGTKGGRPGLKVLKPLFVYDATGGYAPEIKSLLAGRAVSGSGESRGS
jgi:tRNA1Val (adenine37-N6)-methyltransferase